MMMLRKLIGGWRVDKEQILPSGKGLDENEREGEQDENEGRWRRG